ncbi:hypothetical protein ACS8Y6_08240 [Salinisphaera sp. RV14]|uniref:hypothetical protein n=1 Tax=unclassified Salinisphaera TaxID=2649847 RepID=UPI003F852D5D
MAAGAARLSGCVFAKKNSPQINADAVIVWRHSGFEALTGHGVGPNIAYEGFT